MAGKKKPRKPRKPVRVLSMAHNWGCYVPDHVSTEEVFEIRDKLRSGAMDFEFPAGIIDTSILDHDKIEEWRGELKSQMLAAYEREAMKRAS